MKGKLKALSLLKEQQETIRVSSDYDRFIPHGLQRISRNARKANSWPIGQLLRIWNVMRDGERRTLRQIATLTGDPEASVSAQLRNFRKKENGGHDLRKNYLGNGLYQYSLVKP